jgi:hypothetical protein
VEEKAFKSLISSWHSSPVFLPLDFFYIREKNFYLVSAIIVLDFIIYAAEPNSRQYDNQ